MGHKGTDPSKINYMMEQCAAYGFSPFHVKTDSMGYIYNRYVVKMVRFAEIKLTTSPEFGRQSNEKLSFFSKKVSARLRRSTPFSRRF